jgi:hypothetical protein
LPGILEEQADFFGRFRRGLEECIIEGTTVNAGFPWPRL